MNELQVVVQQTPGTVTWNYEDLKKAITNALEVYKTTEYDDSIDGAIVRMGPKKKLKARAVWYHDMKAQIVSAADAGSLDQEEENQEGVEDEEG